MLIRYCLRLRAATVRRLWRRGLLAGGLLSGACGPALGQVRVLFVGNSYTHGAYSPVLTYNQAAIIDENAGLPPGNPRYEDPVITGQGPWGGIPGIVKKFTDQAGLNYEIHLETISGVALQFHHANALAVIKQPQWDRVVLQEQSTLPLPVARGGNPAAFATYATLLEQAVHAVNPAAKLYLYQTWARADFLYIGGAAYAGSTVEVMTQDLHDTYYQVAATNGHFAAVAPVGDAWLRAIQAGVALRNPFGQPSAPLNLWSIDNHHPSRWGAYLAACVLYGQLTGRDPRTLGATEQAAAALGITPGAAVALQLVAFQQLAATGGSLPVTLVSFAAQRQAAGVALRWVTASEHHNARFEVERSADGGHFATVAVVPGHGTTSQPTSYAALDALAPAGLLYYRLRQVDTDGQVTFSPVVVVGGVEEALLLFPNPAHEVLLLAAPAATAYQLRTVLGQLLRQGLLVDGAAAVSLAGLKPGVYFMEVDGGSGRVVRRFAKE